MFESVEKLPYGLAALQVNGVQQHIAELSPRGVVVRAMTPVAADAVLRFSFYRPETASYEPVEVHAYVVESVQRQDGAVLTRLSFLENAALARAVRRVLNDYARYVQLRSEYGASGYGSALGICPADDGPFHESIAAQRAAWHAALLRRGPILPGNREVAVCLDTPQMVSLYLKTPGECFMQAYMKAKHIPEELLRGCAPSRLYVGNMHCALLFPDEETLWAVMDKARAEGMALTLVTAQLREDAVASMRALLAKIAKHAPERMEIVFNDWGMLMLLQQHLQALEPVLGTRLNPRRKDPRMGCKAGAERQAALLAENALSGAGYRAYLRRFGVSRYEFETCGVNFHAPPGQHSIHLPYYQTNTSMYCPLRACCETGDRGMQSPDTNCPAYCERNGFLYPAQLKLEGRFNSLIALDNSPDWQVLEAFNRWVLNF